MFNHFIYNLNKLLLFSGFCLYHIPHALLSQKPKKGYASPFYGKRPKLNWFFLCCITIVPAVYTVESFLNTFSTILFYKGFKDRSLYPGPIPLSFGRFPKGDP